MPSTGLLWDVNIYIYIYIYVVGCKILEINQAFNIISFQDIFSELFQYLFHVTYSIYAVIFSKIICRTETKDKLARARPKQLAKSPKQKPYHAQNASGQKGQTQKTKNRTTHTLKQTTVKENNWKFYNNQNGVFTEIGAAA